MIVHARENQIEIAAPAKVNFFLELLARRSDGYHELETVMSSVSIFDRLRFQPRDDDLLKLTVRKSVAKVSSTEDDQVPTDERNLVMQALQLVRRVAEKESETPACRRGLDTLLEKNIPSAAGLGGASSDAAAALVGANLFWELNWPLEKLAYLAAKLGSDVPFFLYSGTAICRGRGERVQPIPAPAQIPVVIAKPTFSLSTPSVFKQVVVEQPFADSVPLIESIQKLDAKTLGLRMFNRLQQFAEPLTQSISDQYAQLRYEFSRVNCVGHQMSGSGSSYFGVFPNAHVARKAAFCLSSRLPDVRIILGQTLMSRPSLN